jgi:hypothetical protein
MAKKKKGPVSVADYRARKNLPKKRDPLVETQSQRKRRIASARSQTALKRMRWL